MAENTFEFECMRAELLGVEKPDYDEYLRKKKEQDAKNFEDEDLDTENLKEAVRQDDDLQNISGGIGELSNILTATQKKLNRFKATCGSLTNLLKIKMGHADSSESLNSNSNRNIHETADGSGLSDSKCNLLEEDNQEIASIAGGSGSNQRKSDLTKALDKHVDKLDALINKAEDCQYSMAQQNKQMKRFLK